MVTTESVNPLPGHAPGHRSHSLVRLEAFSDGVYAVAITLLALDLKPVHLSTPFTMSRFDFRFLYPFAIHLITFFYAFLFIANWWRLLVSAFGGVTRATWKLVWLTLLHLSFVCLMPWAAAMIAANPTVPQVLITSGAVGWFAGGVLYLLVRHVDAAFPLALPRRSRTDFFITVGSGVAIASGFISVYLCYALFLLHPLVYFTPRKLREKIFRVQTGQSDGI